MRPSSAHLVCQLIMIWNGTRIQEAHDYCFGLREYSDQSTVCATDLSRAPLLNKHFCHNRASTIGRKLFMIQLHDDRIKNGAASPSSPNVNEAVLIGVKRAMMSMKIARRRGGATISKNRLFSLSRVLNSGLKLATNHDHVLRCGNIWD